MRAKRTHYEKEFKQTIVDLMGSGKSLKSVCSEYQLNESMVRRWKKEYQTDTGAFKDEATLLLEQENRRLKKALKDAQEERDILKKAVSIFSVRD
jgi:transposase